MMQYGSQMISQFTQQPEAANTGLADEPTKIIAFNSLTEAACLWLNFQQQAEATAYHSYQWAEAWQSTVGAKLKARPRIVAGFGKSGALLFILPLQLRRKRGQEMLEWLGSPDIPFGHGLFARGFMPNAAAWFSDNIDRVLAATGHYDLLRLDNMPETMFGHPHPLTCILNLPTANETYVLKLDSDYPTLYARRRNAETRRANRRKDNRLTEAGLLEFRQITDPAELSATIDVMLEHKIAKLAAEGIHGVFDDAVCNMLRKLAHAKSDSELLFTTHALTLDGNIVACTFGGWLNGTYWFYVSSISGDHTLTKHSPGDLALRKTIEACCEGGLASFDFGAGSAAYKVGWTDETVRLFASIKAGNTAALPIAGFEAGLLLLKGWIKRHPVLKQLAFGLRRKFSQK